MDSLQLYPQVLIVVGPEYIGKTWMCQQLMSEQLPYQPHYKKLENALKRATWEKISWADREAATWKVPSSRRQLFIYDRFPYPDESVYGYLSEGAIKKWDELLADINALIVFVLPRDLPQYMAQVGRSRDSELAPLMKGVIGNYHRMAETTSVDKLVIDVEDLCRERELKMVVDKLKGRKVF